MKFLYLLALIGAACALQYPLEYQYRYSGRVGTGIPSIYPQLSALGIKAKVIIQMKKANQGIVQMKDVLVGNMNGEVNSVFLRNPIPISFKPLSQELQREIEQPFSINLIEDKDHVMDVPLKEKLWITNIKKAVIEMFLLEPIRFNKESLPTDPAWQRDAEVVPPTAYSIEEETLFGRCESQYTIVHLPQQTSLQIDQSLQNYVQVDVQSRKSNRFPRISSIPKLQDQLWKLTRTINFDKCHERVILQQSTLSNTSKAGHSQFEGQQSRSSYGIYYLRGGPGSFRVEKAIVEGSVLKRPFGMKADKLQVITNQTLILEKASEISSSLQLPATRPVKTWRYEVLSPFSPPFGYPKHWVDYTAKGSKFTPVSLIYGLLGIKPNSQELMVKVEEEISKASQELLNINQIPSEIPSIESNSMTEPVVRLQVASAILQILPIEKIEEIYKVIFSKQGKQAELEQVLLVDASAVAGTSASMKVLLEYMESRKISSSRAASIFITLANQLSSPAIIPELLDYVKSIDIDESPYLASAALINFAKLANRMCLNKRAQNYTAMNALYGSEMCKKSIILEEYLPYLRSLLQRLPKSYQKAIVVQAISELGTPEAIPLLLRVIQKEYSKSPRVISSALFALSHERIGQQKSKQVYDILLRIIDDSSYLPELKQGAIVALMSHNPPATYYQRLARRSWYEKSQSTAAFIYFTLRSLSQSKGIGSRRFAEKAQFALPLAKPFSPSSHYSYNIMSSSYQQEDEIQTEVSATKVMNLKSVIPKELYLYWSSVFSGYKVSPLQVGIFADGVNTQLPKILEELHKLRLQEEPESYRHPRNTLNHESILRAMRKISRELPVQSNPEFAVMIRMLNNMVSYLPFNKELSSKLFGPEAAPFIKKLTEGLKYNLTKFVEPVQYTYVIPTEVGLPLLSSTKMPVVQYISGHAMLNISRENPRFEPTFSELASEKNVSLLLKSKYKLITRLISKFIIYSPWDKKQIESGVDNAKVINLPLYVNISLQNKYEKKGFRINLSSISKREFAPLYTHNIPYTAIRTLYPKVPDYREAVEIKPITLSGKQSPQSYKTSEGTSKYTGITSRAHFSGDIPSPFTSAKAFEYLRNPIKIQKLLSSPTSRYFMASYIVKPMISPSKNISLSAYYSSGYLSRHLKEELIKPEISLSDAKYIAYRKLSALPSRSSDIQISLVDLKLSYNATEKRQYQAGVLYSKENEPETRTQNSYNKYLATLFLKSNPIPSLSSEPKEVRIEAEARLPNITSMRTLQEILSVQPALGSSYSLKAYIPAPFKSKIELQGSMSVSEKRRPYIQKEVEGICSYDKYYPTSEFQIPAIYDRGQFKINYDWEKLPMPIKNYTYIVEEIAKGMYYPFVYINKLNVQNRPNQLSISLERPIESGNYKLVVEEPKKEIIFEKVYIPEQLVSLIPFSGIQKSCKRNIGLESSLLPELHLSQCRISKEKITPFNKQSYPFNPLRCYTKVAYDPDHSDEFVVEVRDNVENNLEVRLSSPVHAVSIRISKNEILVNGKRVHLNSLSRYIVYDQNKKEIGYIFEVPDGHIYAVVNHRYVIRLKHNDLHLFDLKTHRSLVGACGNTNSFEMVGPSGCIYRNENTLLLKYAYSRPEGHKCDQDDYESHMSRVREFQRKCSKKNQYTIGRSPLLSEKPRQECTKFEYPVISDERQNICISVEPFPLCAPSCYGKMKEVQVKLKCYHRRSAPRHLQSSLPKRYSKYMVNESPDYEIFSLVPSYRNCQKY